MKQLIRYLAAGSVNTLVTYLAVIMMIEILNIELLISNLIGYILGICCSYLLNRNYVFKGNAAKKRKSFPLFILVFLIAYGTNISALLLLSNTIKLGIYLSQFLAMATYSIVFYWLCKEWVFKRNNN